jgi:hypothetical protein
LYGNQFIKTDVSIKVPIEFELIVPKKNSLFLNNPLVRKSQLETEIYDSLKGVVLFDPVYGERANKRENDKIEKKFTQAGAAKLRRLVKLHYGEFYSAMWHSLGTCNAIFTYHRPAND